MKLLIASDIFGLTESLIGLENQLIKKNPTAIIDPYHGELKHFSTRQDAEDAFAQEGGFEAYLEQLKIILMFIEQPVTLVGFGIGANAMWQLLDKELGFEAKLFIGFNPDATPEYLKENQQISSRIFLTQDSQLATSNLSNLNQINYIKAHSDVLDPTKAQYNPSTALAYLDL